MKKDEMKVDGRYVVEWDVFEGGVFLATVVEVGVITSRSGSGRADGCVVELNEPLRGRYSEEDSKIGDRRKVRNAQVLREPTEEDIAAFMRRQHVRDANAQTAMLLRVLGHEPEPKWGGAKTGFVLKDDGRALVPIDMLRSLAISAVHGDEGPEALQAALDQVEARGPAGFLPADEGGQT